MPGKNGMMFLKEDSDLAAVALGCLHARPTLECDLKDEVGSGNEGRTLKAFIADGASQSRS